MVRSVQTAALWFAAPVWHLWRIATGRPVYGTLGNNRRAERVMVMMFLAAGLLRHTFASGQEVSGYTVINATLSVALWAFIVIFALKAILSVVVQFARSAQEKKYIIDVAILNALGCSVVVDLSIFALAYLLDQNAGKLWLGPFILDVLLITINTTVHVQQARLHILNAERSEQARPQKLPEWRLRLRIRKHLKRGQRGL